MSRGVDLDVECVICYDVPKEFLQYVHRAGRTSRAGKSGMVLTVFTNEADLLMQNVHKAKRKFVFDKATLKHKDRKNIPLVGHIYMVKDPKDLSVNVVRQHVTSDCHLGNNPTN
ncbi:unnamed protein product [Soboliphyme baturini]|uniref:ATP-dependent RNA helicase n=1 Tax=Soboliphyme baturini TaxID=241478 RepID=A0A183IKZ8_9BILA|nr:unnamed protein product [Soboliphyme baturini]